MKRNILRLVFGASILGLFTVTCATAQFVDLENVKAGRYDNGKMWTFDYPPVEHLAETYDFTPDQAWFEKARLGALRLPNCTASFVSPHGLVMTNHHCARTSVALVSAESEALLDHGFTSMSLDEERQVPGLYVDQLIALADVTDEVYAALEGQETDAEKAAARQEAIARISSRIGDEAGGDEADIFVQVIDLYNGGRYSAYTFRRFKDVRLVMAPELQLGYFGGDTDNFTYPRYALDMSFLRVYENDEPYRPEHFFKWSAEGADEGDLVFVLGNPGSTLRLQTVSQLEWRRDVEEIAKLSLYNTRIDVLMEYYRVNPSSELLNLIFSLRNASKLYTGRVKGLHDPVLMAKRMDNESQFLDDLAELYGETVTADVSVPYFSIIDELDRIQDLKREYAAEYAAFLSMTPGGRLASATINRALMANVYLKMKELGMAEAALDQTALQIVQIDQDPEIDRRFFKARLTEFVHYFGAGDATVQKALAGRTIDEAVADVFTNSVLADVDKASEALEAGSLTPDDPAVRLMAPFMVRHANYQSAFAGLTAQETELNALHGRARFEVYGTSRPPDATFSMRIADGVVSSYEYNGSHAPAFTTYYGLYNRHHAHAADVNGTGEWALPDRWLDAPETFDRSTPLNLVATNDIIGGNSGSPMVNRNLEVVGLVFDGNIESLPSAYIYETERSRAVAVDVRGMQEALDEIYQMHRIVLELGEGILTETEAEADATL
jgi:hypothetical protein